MFVNLHKKVKFRVNNVVRPLADQPSLIEGLLQDPEILADVVREIGLYFEWSGRRTKR